MEELEGFHRLVAQLEKNHDFRDFGKDERLCKGCLQSLNFLIYSRQTDCISKQPKPRKRSPINKRGRRIVASADDFKLQSPD